jgi:hypothetical protein
MGSALSPYRDGVRVPDEEIDQEDPGRDPTIVWRDKHGKIRNFLEEQNKYALKKDAMKKEADIVAKRMDYLKKFNLASTKKKEAAKKEEGDESFDAPDIVRPEKWTPHDNRTGDLLLSNKQKYVCVLASAPQALPEPAALFKPVENKALPEPAALFKPVENKAVTVLSSKKFSKEFLSDYDAYSKVTSGATKKAYIPVWEAHNPGLSVYA